MGVTAFIEEESRQGEERPIIAGILWKRIASRVLLGVDAANRYMLGKRKEVLTHDDLEVDSKYNTRKHLGLPPTPIANAGASAFEAALKPKTSEYWYYLHGSDGRVHYAVTNEEHNKNRAKYLR